MPCPPCWLAYALMPFAVVGVVAIGAAVYMLLERDDDGEDRWR
jgi:hypothetical protein